MSTSINIPNKTKHRNHQELLSGDQEEKLFAEFLSETEPKKQKRLLDRIVRSYVPIVRKSVKDLSGYGCDPLDLEQEGYLGLVSAAYRFDPALGWKFSTFAKSWVRGKMMAFITQNKFIVNVCTSHKKKKLFFQLRRRVAEELRRNSKFEMTYELAEELANEFEVSVSDIQNINSLFQAPATSLNEFIEGYGDSERIERMDLLADDSLSPEKTYQENEITTMQKKLFMVAMDNVLTPREKKIFEAQMLRDEDEERTLDDLGKEFNVSKERVRQLRNIAMERIQKEVHRLCRGGSPTDIMI
jgi:RNA polymerase sigma-32 factor